MSVVAAEATYSPEELLLLPDGGKGFELVDGRLVEKNMGGFASWVGGRVLRLVGEHGEDTGLGWVLDSEGSYQCFPDSPKKVRKPDVSFIRRGRLPDERIPDGHIKIAPDLAVEVVSPNDIAYEVEDKIQEYLGARVVLVWVVYPQTRTVHIYHLSGDVERLGEEQELTAPELLPTLRCMVGDLFTVPSPQ